MPEIVENVPDSPVTGSTGGVTTYPPQFAVTSLATVAAEAGAASTERGESYDEASTRHAPNQIRAALEQPWERLRTL